MTWSKPCILLVLVLASARFVVAASAAHPISAVYGDAVATESTLTVILDEDAASSMHVQPVTGATMQNTASAWLARSLHAHDRYGQPVSLMADPHGERIVVRSAPTKLQYPLSLVYTPSQDDPLVPPVRFVLSRPGLEGVAYTVPNTGAAQRIDSIGADPIHEVEASNATITRNDDGWVLKCSLPIQSLPGGCRPDSLSVHSASLSPEVSKEIIGHFEDLLRTVYPERGRDRTTESAFGTRISIPGVATEDGAPVNLALARIEFTRALSLGPGQRSTRIRLPLEALALPSMAVRVQPENATAVRGLVTRQDPWVVIDDDGVRIGRDANTADAPTR